MMFPEEMKNRLQDDPRVRVFVDPARIVWKSPTGLTGEDALLAGQAAVCAMQRAAGGEPPGILLDFGCELHGGLRIECRLTNPLKPARFRVRFGESASEAMGEPDNDHAMHDFEATVAAAGYTEVGSTGFRFARLDLLGEDTRVDLKAVRAVSIHRNLPWLGSFECSDPRLNEIWKVGARTVHLCMQDYLWDGIKRDRMVWIGDIHPETRVVSAVFGKVDVVEKSLDYARDSYPLPLWMNGISSYSLWWILTHADWYRYHGDAAYLGRQREYLCGLLKLVLDHVDSCGREKLGDLRFLDWSTSEDKQAVAAGLQALTILALRAGAFLCGVLGEGEAARQARTCADKMTGLGKLPGSRKSPAALMALAGMLDAREANATLLAVDPCKDVSLFYGYYLLQARALAGDTRGCMDVIRHCWGGMLDLGATSFWESFDPAWKEGAAGIADLVPPGMKDIHADFGQYCYKGLRHSLCHGWSAGPTAWLAEYVLGVSPLEPGFKTVQISPDLADLKWARGTIPTPQGLVTVRHEARGDGTIATEFTLPEGVRAAAPRNQGEQPVRASSPRECVLA